MAVESLSHCPQEPCIQESHIEAELNVVAEMVRFMMPSECPRAEGFDIAFWSLPSHTVGGDYYDFIELPDQHIGIAVADVAGKGIPASLTMVATRANLRAEAEYMYRVRDIVARVNRALLRDTRPHEFVTLFYAALNTTARVLTYTNAGHPPPILLRRDEERFLKEGGPPLGLLREAPYQEEQAQLQRGDVILLYTDGVIETSGENQEFFGEERLFRALRDHRDVPAAEILFHILISISAFASGLRQRDDLTLVVIKVK